MEAMLEICLAILIPTKKNAMSFLLLFMSSLQQNWRRGQNRFFLEVRGVGEEEVGGEQGGEMAQTMYVHMNKKKVT
jgi:hypothetical protein